MNELFEYADSGYSMVYDNGTVKSSIFNTIEKYACLYMIYSQPTPLDTSNYAIREDFRFKDYGCFPIFDGDLFRSSKESEKYSQYSHIINFDPFRPGKAFDEKTRYDEAVEFGIGVVQEVAKERKNRYTQTGKKDDLVANQSNDLFELDTKMRGHVATIDNFDFWRWLFDDQRPDSLGADSKDLTTICQIKKTSDAKIVLPLFAIEELLYEIAQKIHDKIYDFIRNRKNSDTLLVYFMKMLFNPLFKLYDRVEARYSVYTSRIKTTDAMDKEVIGEAEKVYILSAMAYNDKFATDSCRTFYRRKHLHAKRSLNDRVQYKSLYPTRDEYRIQRSYFFEDMNETFDGENERKEKVQEALTQQSSVQTKQRGKGSKTGV